MPEKYANLFYVKGDGTFEFMEGVLVDEGGFASYAFTHASDYVIAVTDVEYTGQELNPKPVEPAVEPESEGTEDTISSSTTTESETEATNADASDASEESSPTPDKGGKTESIFISPLFYIAIAVVLAVIGFVIFTVLKKKK